MSNYKLYPSRKIHNLREMLDESASRFGISTAFLQKVDGKYKPYSYNRFKSDVDALGTALTARGFAGKRIIVTGENCYMWCVSYMTAVCGLGVVVPVDKEIPAEEIANIAKISEASLILYSKKYEHKLASVDESVTKICFDDISDLIFEGKTILESGNRDYFDISIDVDALCSLIFTSGTTGVSKGVMLSQRNLCCNIENLAKLVKVEPGDTALSVLPLHHVYECTAGFLFPMSRGASIGFSEGVRYIMKNLKEVRPTKMLCVPLLIETMYNKIWANIRKKGIEHKVRNVIKATDIIKPASARMAAKRKAFAEIHNSMGGNLNLIVSGGAPIDPEVLRGMRQFGFRIIQGYGLTECGPLAAVNPDTASKDISAGVVLPGGEFKIINKGEDGIGEICYRGDNVMLGYYKQPEMTAEIKKNGWLFTGDLGYVDEDGYLIITGRKKNIIVTANGKNIFPEELETYLSRSPFVSECVVVGIMNEKKKDYDIVALVYPNFEYAKEVFGLKADSMLYEALSSAVDGVNSIVQSYKRINMMILRNDEFPKSSSRKIKRIGIVDSVMDEYLALRG